MQRLSMTALAAIVALSACSITQSEWQTDVKNTKADVDQLFSVINSDMSVAGVPAATVAKVEADEALADAGLTTLESSSSPTSASSVLTLVNNVIADLPPSVLSTAHKAEAQAVIATIQVLVSLTTTTSAVVIRPQLG